MSVVPHAGTWIEILVMQGKRRGSTSCPTRARGLKLDLVDGTTGALKSCPTRARGLKFWVKSDWIIANVVPHAGTWIEMSRITNVRSVTIVVPHAGTWIEIGGTGIYGHGRSVVPHAGTWIEIGPCGAQAQPIPSCPTRARGLKSAHPDGHGVHRGRAPRGHVD